MNCLAMRLNRQAMRDIVTISLRFYEIYDMWNFQLGSYVCVIA